MATLSVPKWERMASVSGAYFTKKCVSNKSGTDRVAVQK